MTADDQARWDERYDCAPPPVPRCPELFVPYQSLFPTEGTALDIACGAGSGSLWLAERGMTVLGVDISVVALTTGQILGESIGMAKQCRFEAIDLDDGLSPGPPVDVVTCHRYRQRSLYQAMLNRLKPGGLLAVAVLSEVDAGPGRFRAQKGELSNAFASLEELVSTEVDGVAVYVGKRRTRQPNRVEATRLPFVRE